MRVLVSAAALCFLVLASAAAVRGQETVQVGASPQRVVLAPGIERIAGTDPVSRIEYERLILQGSLRTAGGSFSVPAQEPPLLIAQCTHRPDGKYLFELLASFGAARNLAFYPPWAPVNAQDLFPPQTVKSILTMEFLGYTHVKPLRRQWEIPVEAPGLYRYNTPGRRSANMEDAAYALRYLLALPTLHLSLGDQMSEFQTAAWIAEIRKEPLCRAAGL